MPPAERRNLYRILYVQPEAPHEVIKASYRALMSTLRAHPDLGGDHERAARLNGAWAVLGDPEQRRAYDRSLRRPSRGGAGAASVTAAEAPPAASPAAWRADRCCPLCRHPLPGEPRAGLRCTRCESPLAPAPAGSGGTGSGEILGRRAGERFARDMALVLRLPGVPGDLAARLRDLSISGLAFLAPRAVPRGSAVRVIGSNFDTVAEVVACRAASGGHSVHARLLTLQMLNAGRGVVIDTKA
jgi:curved DNA-binding protein CbpA